MSEVSCVSNERSRMGEQKVKIMEGAPQAKQAASSPKSKKKKRIVPKGRIYIRSSYNNTSVTVTDEAGDVICWGTAGLVGFRGSKKSTPYAAQRTMEDLIVRMKKFGLQEVEVFLRGIGSGRESAVRALQSAGLAVTTIKDITPTPHGGVRPKKPRRV